MHETIDQCLKFQLLYSNPNLSYIYALKWIEVYKPHLAVVFFG